LLRHLVFNCNHIAQGQKMEEDASPHCSECPVARTLEAIGDRWSLMIIRDAFDDIRRFSEFQKSLGVAKNILASRLKTLVEVGVFDVRPASDGSAYKEYVLTDKGRRSFRLWSACGSGANVTCSSRRRRVPCCWTTRPASL
jgi:DNA-binding HxlR family transcriptional regulator